MSETATWSCWHPKNVSHIPFFLLLFLPAGYTGKTCYVLLWRYEMREHGVCVVGLEKHVVFCLWSVSIPVSCFVCGVGWISPMVKAKGRPLKTKGPKAVSHWHCRLLSGHVQKLLSHPSVQVFLCVWPQGPLWAFLSGHWETGLAGGLAGWLAAHIRDCWCRSGSFFFFFCQCMYAHQPCYTGYTWASLTLVFFNDWPWVSI